MKLITRIPELENVPLTFFTENYSENSAHILLNAIIDKAREIFSIISSVYRENWANNPPNYVRKALGCWMVNASRHFCASIILSENYDLSLMANVHYRQIFEDFLQIRFYTSQNDEDKEKLTNRIAAIGFIEWLEKMNPLKTEDFLSETYEKISKKLDHFDKLELDQIEKDRKKRNYYWFGCSFSELAKRVSKPNEDLRSVYKMISADIHGAYSLSLDVYQPEPDKLDFRGYPNKTTLYLRAAEMLDQITSLYMNLWNEIAIVVGAEMVYYQGKKKCKPNQN